MLDAIRTFVARRILTPGEATNSTAAPGPSGVQLAACARVIEHLGRSDERDVMLGGACAQAGFARYVVGAAVVLGDGFPDLPD